MSALILAKPHCPLVFRSGRGFGPGSGGVDTAGFPPPGTFAGALRALYADAVGWKFDGAESHRKLRERIAVAGPFLAARALPGQARGPASPKLYVPKPADALYFRQGESWKAVPLKPLDADNGSGCDMPLGLRPLMLQEESRAKPHAGPQFWSLEAMAEWLASASAERPESAYAPPLDVRTHVGIDDEAGAAEEGRLFQSAGLDFSTRRLERAWGFEAQAWALAARIDAGADEAGAIDEELRRVGGEGRSATFTLRAADDPLAIPEKLATALNGAAQGSLVRIVLATPAIFADGWLPRWLATGAPPGCSGVKLELVAAAVDRWQPYSGWDLETGKPRAVRRLVPAGAVYWFKLVEGAGAALRELWMRPVSDDAQDRRDGFGIALPGIGYWDGHGEGSKP